MAFVCDVVIGFVDTAAFWCSGVVRASKPLDTEQVHRLQIACDQVFGVKARLIDYFADDGLLRIHSLSVSPDIYRVACLAHELFGMSAIDEAHRWPVYPTEDWEAPSIENLVEDRRRHCLDANEVERRERARAYHRRMTSWRAFQRETQERVRSFAREWRYLV
jgi:hypothetical protein